MSMGGNRNLAGGNFNGPICRVGDLCDPAGESEYGGAYRTIAWPGHTRASEER